MKQSSGVAGTGRAGAGVKNEVALTINRNIQNEVKSWQVEINFTAEQKKLNSLSPDKQREHMRKLDEGITDRRRERFEFISNQKRELKDKLRGTVPGDEFKDLLYENGKIADKAIEKYNNIFHKETAILDKLKGYKTSRK